MNDEAVLAARYNETATGGEQTATAALSAHDSGPLDLAPYDAVLLVSFGGPEQPDDVVPFLENVTRGRGIPRERLLEVGEHYFHFGGRSPINDQCRELLAALREALEQRGSTVPVYWGNRNWHPFLADTFAEITAAGHSRILALTTSGYPSYSSCRQYRENLFDTAAHLPLSIDRVRQYGTHPGFVTASVDATCAALDELDSRDPGAALGSGARLVFVTHSIPTAMAETSGPGGDGYVRWHTQVAASVTEQVAARRGQPYGHDLTYCSRSGPPSQPWLEPDVNDHLRALHSDGCPAVVVIPIGFVSDHMEVVYDLDTEAAETAEEIGLPFVRAATAGVHPAFVDALVDVLAERAAVSRGEDTVPAVVPGGEIGLWACFADCCPNLRDRAHGALCQLPYGGAADAVPAVGGAVSAPTHD